MRRGNLRRESSREPPSRDKEKEIRAPFGNSTGGSGGVRGAEGGHRSTRPLSPMPLRTTPTFRSTRRSSLATPRHVSTRRSASSEGAVATRFVPPLLLTSPAFCARSKLARHPHLFMLEPRPSRREPRLLVVEVDPRVVRVLVLDAWEIRTVDVLPANPQALAFALWRVFVQARPSHILLSQRTAHAWNGRRVLARLALKKGLPFAAIDRLEGIALAKVAPVFDELVRAYPEVAHLLRGPKDPVVRAFRTAVGALLTRSLPPRHYAVSGLPPHASPRVDR
jgi:hypothetical protein